MQPIIRVKLAALAIAAAGTFLPSTPVQATPILQIRCTTDALDPATARLRLEWARACGVSVNLVSPAAPTPPALAYLTGLVSANGGIPLSEYIETNDFWGKNSYSGDVEAVNQIFTQSQWRVGPYTATTVAGGFQKWTESATLALARPVYPTFGNNLDINVAIPLFPNPNYALLDCKLYTDAAATHVANTSVTGFYVNGYCSSTAISTIAGRCADGTQEQTFIGGMVGCAGAVPFANRNALCAPGFRTVSAAEWITYSGAVPTHDYWTSNDLKFSGTGTSACFASAETGTSCGATPMRVCTAAGTDAEGNQCSWQHCGLDAISPDQFFGGCSGNTTAGALCIVGGCADGSIEQTFAGGMVGCAATATYANRATLCGPGYRLATAADWVALRNGIAPTHNYWTNDALKYSGSGPSSCFVSTSVGTDCGTTPMRVCAGTDPEGNVCNWTHCGIDANTPDQFFGGCAGNVSAGALCVPNMGCADGSVEQVFAKGMVGCAGAVTFANRDTLCAPGYQPATAAQWVVDRGTTVPAHDYWTDDALKWSGSGPSACFVSTSVGNTTCGASPMRVCTALGTDAEGNTCNWTHCGINANTPDQFFGGCGSNAGTLCIPSGGTTGTLFTTRFPVAERHSVQGANTASSFAAAAMMGAQGFSNAVPPGNWESMISSSCTAQTTSQTGGSLWPAGCSPSGMASAVTAFSSNDWETRTWAATDKTIALNETVASLQFYQSPAVVPIYGQADHLAAITQISATNSGGSWTINTVKAVDGGPSGQMDSGTNSYLPGLQSMSGFVWANVFYQPVTVINPSCNDLGCTADPYYNRYVLMFDPPRGQSHPPVSAVFAKAPGVDLEGRYMMDEHLAQTQVWKALASAGVDADPEISKAIRGGVPGDAFQVNAVWPSGSPWHYYLVPILSKANTAVAFVQLAADDGSFESIHVPTNPMPFAPVTMKQAQQRARSVLAHGERLTAGTLTWDPRITTKMAKSPLRPYYKFGVVNASHPKNAVGTVQVTFNNGTVVRSP
jgi:hypothetical protein